MTRNKSNDRSSGKKKRHYTTPELKRFGSIGKLTCGASGNAVDSETIGTPPYPTNDQ